MRSEMRAVALSLTCIGSTVVVDAVGLTLGAGGDASGGHGVAEALEFGVAGWGGGTRGGPSRAGGGSRAGRGAEGDVQRGGSRARRARGGPAARVSWSTQLRLEVEVDVLLVRAERLLGEGDAGAALAVMEELIGVQEGSGVVLPDDFGLRYARVALAAGGAERALASLREYLGTVARGDALYREGLELLEGEERRLQRAARWPAGKVFQDCGVCPEMVVLPDSRVAVGRYEVTVGEYRTFMVVRDDGAEDPRCEAFGAGDSWRNPGYDQTDRYPAVCVSWDDARAYVLWLSERARTAYRLPSEAEWEVAAAGSVAGCNGELRRLGACTVGLDGANAAGLSDMVGNVLEWTEDCFEGDCDRRVLRGGSWGYAADNLHIGARVWHTPDGRDGYIGFRIARTLD